MQLIRRKHGSQRPSRPLVVKLWPNSAGQGGDSTLTLRTEHGDWLILVFETDAEARELMSQSQIIFRHTPNEEQP